MKLVHLSDLHLGKRVNEYSMIEDQEYILKKILNIIDAEHPDGMLIAGDVYDKSIPPVEAVELFDDFLYRLNRKKVQVFVISGNHDSPERLAFGNRLMEKGGIHICSAYSGGEEVATLKDEFGETDIHMLPFVKPVNVRHYFPEETIESYTDALSAAIRHMTIREDCRNVLITHQFVTGAERSDSEEVSVGGTDNVDASVFAPFDYVALGHIHRPQNVTSGKIRYCGTPLKYSLSEAKDQKSITVVELQDKGTVNVRTIPLQPMRDMAELKGTFDELMLRKSYEGTTLQEDYVGVTLTDEDEVPNAMSRLGVVYHNIMKISYDNQRTRNRARITGAESVEKKSPLELFSDLFEQQNSTPMSPQQEDFVQNLIENIWEDRT